MAFWQLGENLGVIDDRDRRAHELERSRDLVTGLRDQPEGFPRLTFGVVADEFPKYALPGQNLDLLGVETRAWGTMTSPLEVMQYLEQRRNLTALWNLNAPFLAWVDATPPRVVRASIWGEDVPPSWGTPRASRSRFGWRFTRR